MGSRHLNRRIAFAAGLLAVCLMMLGRPGPSLAATNQATNLPGGSVTLSPSGALTVNAVNLSLVKQARDLAGAVLPAGSNVAVGQQIYFVLYVDNVTGITANDIRMNDPLNESQFTYVAGSLETTAVASGSNDAAIWAGAWTPLTDGVGGPDDIGSALNTGGLPDVDRITIGAVAGQANQVLSIPGSTLRAVRFLVTVK